MAQGKPRGKSKGRAKGKGGAKALREDLLARIRTIERAIASVGRPLPVAGLAGFSRGDR